MKHSQFTSIFGALLLISSSILSSADAGTLVIESGFEEATGLTGSQPPVENYIFGTSYESYWQAHTNGTEVISNCGGNTAYEGNYYWHLQFYTGRADPCLGTTPSSVNTHSNVGMETAYPTGTQFPTELSQLITSDTMTVKFFFRMTGNWTSSNTTDGGGGLKFIRVFGSGMSGDSSAALLKTINDGDSTNQPWYVYNPGGNPYYTLVSPGVDVQDGDWHSVVFLVHLNNRNNSPGNVDTTFWIDDWGMTGPGHKSTITASTFGSGFGYIELFANWSADSVDDDMGIDIDKFEVWDGTPLSPPSPPVVR